MLFFAARGKLLRKAGVPSRRAATAASPKRHERNDRPSSLDHRPAASPGARRYEMSNLLVFLAPPLRGVLVTVIVVTIACATGIWGHNSSSNRSSSRINNMGWKKFHTVDDVPKDYFDNKRSVYGFVERVIDGDTIRVRHLPGYNWRRWKHPAPLQQRGIANDTMSIRIYGVDCPELASNFSRKPSQPYGPEARDYTSQLVLHRVVRITFLRKDQYKRAVAKVETVPSKLFSWIPLQPFRPKDLSVELATAGFAELYTGGGAEYCDNRDRLERRIDRAKRKKRGMWSLGDHRVSAADYKRGNTAATSARAGGVKAEPIQISSPLGQQRRGGMPRRRDKVLDTVVTGLELAVG